MFYIWWNSDYEIERAAVLIATDKLSGYRLHHYLLEEITQSLGFPGDSDRSNKSVFFENKKEKKYGKATNLSSKDRDLIRLHYFFNSPGDSPVQVGLNFAKFLSETANDRK